MRSRCCHFDPPAEPADVPHVLASSVRLASSSSALCKAVFAGLACARLPLCQPALGIALFFSGSCALPCLCWCCPGAPSSRSAAAWSETVSAHSASNSAAACARNAPAETEDDLHITVRNIRRPKRVLTVDSASEGFLCIHKSRMRLHVF